ncbi:uncharacterized protein LOC126692139 [Quercus robur]|uniref:uncharacterized protein LOC126692139 n=1 Tax=Quercus robur TaxID=38942 RepID=UPI0021632419|nr:uncharacterized protein LOC126692139 [Quercus robur]
MSIARPPTEDPNIEPKRAKMEIQPVLSFSDEDKVGTIQSHDDAVEVTLRIGGYDVKKVLEDQGIETDIKYPDLYKGLNLKPEDLAAYDSPLLGFGGKVVVPRGQIRLPVQASSEVVEVDFIVVDAYSPYTAISGWAKCEKLEKNVINDDLEKFFQVEAQLPPQEKEELIVFLKRNIGMFAWSAYEVPRVDPNFIYHHLNVNPSIIPKEQPPRHSSKDYSNAVKDEVIKLKQAEAIKEVFSPEWLANTVVVKKESEKWRVCVDFTEVFSPVQKTISPCLG